MFSTDAQFGGTFNCDPTVSTESLDETEKVCDDGEEALGATSTEGGSSESLACVTLSAAGEELKRSCD